MVSLPVIWVASSAGTISITTANAPASCDGDRVVDGLLGGVAAALDAEPAEAVDALRGEADVRHHRDAGGVSAAICSATRSPPSSFTACAPVSFMNRVAVASACVGPAS